MGLDARLVYFALVCLFCFVSISLLRKIRSYFAATLKKTWEEREGHVETRIQSLKSITGG